jgi:hypothetical protein
MRHQPKGYDLNFRGWACVDLNHGPLPYQVRAPMGHDMIQPESVVVRVSPVGLTVAGVAVTSAVIAVFGPRRVCLRPGPAGW